MQWRAFGEFIEVKTDFNNGGGIFKHSFWAAFVVICENTTVDAVVENCAILAFGVVVAVVNFKDGVACIVVSSIDIQIGDVVGESNRTSLIGG